MEGLYESGEDYLETILIISQRKGNVRSIDIANEMELSKPSISRAVGILKNKELVVVDEDGFIVLTDEGKKIAKKIYERHQILTEALMMLGVDAKTASKDACRIEHDLSESSFNKIKKCVKSARAQKKEEEKKTK